MVRKLGAPDYEEFGIGAVVDGAQPQVVLNYEAIEMLRVPPAYVAQERDRQLAEIERRRRLYSGVAPLDVAGRTAIVVDDGAATGGTVLAALRALRKAAPARIVLAVPVGPPGTLVKLSTEPDEVVCLDASSDFRAVGVHYADFTQTSDDEVIELLRKQRATAASRNDATH
jgi:putative phosphoribosyl transferase